jgi:glycosyltransferase involved in cell wall biosynthesis
MNNERQRILAVIPAYNEAARLGPVAAAAGSFLPVLVVDDGSSDETALGGRQSGADVLAQTPTRARARRCGRGSAERSNRVMNAVITLDADGQHDPAESPLSARAFAADGGDLIIGRRDFSRMPRVRRLSNTLGTRLFSWALGQPVADNQSGYRLVSRRLMGSALNLPKGFALKWK